MERPEAASAPGQGDGSSEPVEVELAQSLGLAEALTIGIGTMIGAGIFVLPGFIVAEVGPAAVLSFLLGGVIALLNAMAAAEVATGMPKSGGGYYFISRALGPLWGAILGWGGLFGLVFASAFYMVGFGEYVHTVVGLPVMVYAIGMTVILTGLNLVGSKAAGQLQNLIVAVLIAVLLLFLGRGAASAEPSLLFESSFAPFGLGAILAGTATLFVTYAGFGEIASMAEEIRNPGRNLPRALLGSVISVTILYCLILLVALVLRPWGDLTGPTVVADLADDLMGPIGRSAILLGAVLATVSSANASIMSASRISFAMGRDSLIWEWLNEVHARFRVPHRAIVVTGVLTVLVILIGDIEILAEAAGLLHLLLYGLMSLACIILRGARPAAYQPVFRTPLFPLVPLVGALACFGVIFFMEPLTILLGLIIAAFALGHYFLWGRRRTELKGEWPYFIRRGVLEPGLKWVEARGALPDVIPTAIVAVAYPERERARLRLAGALMGPNRGNVSVVSVYRLAERLDESSVQSYYESIKERSRSLDAESHLVREFGATANSHVLVSSTAFRGLVTAAETTGATLLLIGWPGHGPAEAEEALAPSLDRHLRSHLVLFREEGPVPARRILCLVDQSAHGELALRVASRLTSAWNAELTVAAAISANANEEERLRVEGDLDVELGVSIRAAVRAIPTHSPADALKEEAERTDLIVTGVSALGVETVDEAVRDLAAVRDCSLALIRAHREASLEVRR
ncbi:MAG: universal stress protein [Gemmatimonadota bacterium]|jgi:amino acid transporter